MMKLKKFIFFGLIASLLFSPGEMRAQDSFRQLSQLKLPPIEELFKSAMNNPMVQFYELKMEGEELLLKTEKRKWLEYFNLVGTYQYGVMGLNSFTDLGSDFPLIYQYSGTEQVWYNGGIALRLPLDRLFDRNNRIRRQKLKIQETLKERDLWYDDQKSKIIETYFKAQEMLNNLQSVNEEYTIATNHFEDAQRDYVIGKMTSHDLNVAKTAQVKAKMQMEQVISMLNTALMKLEILSNTKIINR